MSPKNASRWLVRVVVSIGVLAIAVTVGCSPWMHGYEEVSAAKFNRYRTISTRPLGLHLVPMLRGYTCGELIIDDEVVFLCITLKEHAIADEQLSAKEKEVLGAIGDGYRKGRNGGGPWRQNGIEPEPPSYIAKKEELKNIWKRCYLKGLSDRR